MTETSAYDGNGAASPQWWPSRYGPDDLIGAGHELTPERTLTALQLPQEGRSIKHAAPDRGRAGLPAPVLERSGAMASPVAVV